jgi:hypothetical protein
MTLGASCQRAETEPSARRWRCWRAWAVLPAMLPVSWAAAAPGGAGRCWQHSAGRCELLLSCWLTLAWMDWLLSSRLMANLLLDDARARMDRMQGTRVRGWLYSILASPDDAPAADVAGRPLRLQFTPVLWNPSRAKAAARGDGAVLASTPLPLRLLPKLPPALRPRWGILLCLLGVGVTPAKGTCSPILTCSSLAFMIDPVAN